MQLIIGYGNRLRGDDAVGVLAAECLHESSPDPQVEILAVHQLTPELAEPISRADRVTFVDACVEGPRGEVTIRSIRSAVLPDAAFTHHATPEGLLAAARALYGRAPDACLISVAGADFSFALEPSLELRRSVDSVVSLLRRILRTATI
jgi:hydrogenase maturation protease